MNTASADATPARDAPKATRPRVASIQFRVTRFLLLGTLIAGAAATTGIYVQLRRELIEQFDAALEARARALAGVVVAQSADGPLAFPSGTTQPEFRRRPGRSDYFQIWDGRGNVVARSPSLSAGENLASAPPHSLSSGAYDDADDPPNPATLGDCVFDAQLPDGRPGYCIEVRFTPSIVSTASFPGGGSATTSPAATQSTVAAPARIVLAMDRVELDDTLRHLFNALVIGAFALAGTSTIVVVGGVRAGLRPLRQLADSAARVDIERLHASAFDDAGLPVELRPIAGRLNDLMARLGAAFARERRFTADAAHELRTPIAELRSLSEVALKWPPVTPAEHEQNYRHLLAGARQMEAIVDALLTLARHHGTGKPARGIAMSAAASLSEDGERIVPDVALADAVAEAWRPHEAAARARGISVRFDVSPELMVDVNRPVFVAMLANLFGNLAAHAPAQSSGACTASDGWLTIENDRGQLSVDDLSQIARPFWRKDPSRTSRDAHAGLGLTLVREYADALGITCGFAVNGNRFVVTLSWTPASSAATAPNANTLALAER